MPIGAALAVGGPAVARFPGVRLPEELLDQAMHLDPDFEQLTRKARSTARSSGGTSPAIARL